MNVVRAATAVVARIVLAEDGIDAETTRTETEDEWILREGEMKCVSAQLQGMHGSAQA